MGALSIHDCLEVEMVWPRGQTLAAFLSSLEDGSDPWHDAELYAVYTYARCSKALRLPSDLKSVLPVRD